MLGNDLPLSYSYSTLLLFISRQCLSKLFRLTLNSSPNQPGTCGLSVSNLSGWDYKSALPGLAGLGYFFLIHKLAIKR